MEKHQLSALGTLINSKDITYSPEITVSTNSNILAQVFIPLKGEKFDGHHFIADALSNSSTIALCSNEYFKQNRAQLEHLPLVVVEDTLTAYQTIALWHRRLFDIPVIAITGSSGKTTLKEMLALLFKGSLKTHANENNDIGVAKTLLSINDTHKAAIIEMGMRGSGEIKRLVEIIEPDVAVITNVSHAHIGQFPDFASLLNAKKEAFDYTKGFCVALDDENTQKLMHGIEVSRQVICYRDSAGKPYSLNSLNIDSDGARFSLSLEGKSLNLNMPNAYNRGIVEDAALACIANYLIEKDIDNLKNIEEFEPLESRGKVYTNSHGATIISDAYNANPSSMRYAIDTLSNQKETLKIACLADMLELGEESPRYHYDIGKYLAQKGINIIIAYGNYSDNYRQGAVDGGMQRSKIVLANDLDEVQTLINHYNSPGHAILIKGSHSTMFYTLKAE